MSGLKSFLNSHPGLQFLGLVLTQACNDETILEATTAIDVSGCGSERQVVEALRRYDNRPQYTQNSLYNLFKFTQPIIGPREDLIMVTRMNVTMETWHSVLNKGVLLLAGGVGGGDIPDRLLDSDGGHRVPVQLVKNRNWRKVASQHPASDR